MLNRNTVILSALAAALLPLFGCFPPKPEKKAAPQYTTVYVAKPLLKPVEVWDDFTARIEGQKSVEIRSRVNGYLEKILFNDGDFVKAGDVMFQIDPRPFQAMVEASKATVKEIESRIDLAKGNLARAEDLFRSNAISKEVLETRKSELFSAEAVLMSAQARLKESELNLEFTKIASPISGYVSRRRVDEGNLINASSTLMATVVSRNVVYAYFQISERDIIKYNDIKLFDSIDTEKHSGPPVKLTLLDELKPSHLGKLTYIDNTLSASSIELRAEIDNPNGKLYPGMFAKISLRAGEPVTRMLLPESAIGTDLVGRYVLVVNKKNLVEYRAVQVGDMVGNKQIVLDGITPEDRIVVRGMQRAIPRKAVTPIEIELK